MRSVTIKPGSGWRISMENNRPSIQRRNSRWSMPWPERNEYEKRWKLRIDELRIRNDPTPLMTLKSRPKSAQTCWNAGHAKTMQTLTKGGRLETDQTNHSTKYGRSIQKIKTNILLKKVIITSRQYLAVPYSEKTRPKAAGARWDKAAKAWYVGENADIRALQRWLPENVAIQQNPAIDAQTGCCWCFVITVVLWMAIIRLWMDCHTASRLKVTDPVKNPVLCGAYGWSSCRIF